jgi:putative endonuclease
MQLVARIGFKFGLRDPQAGAQANKQAALQLGVRGETYAYGYLRRLGYLFLARNYSPSRIKGELDLVGFDGETLVIVEVRTRRATPGQPELSITEE